MMIKRLVKWILSSEIAEYKSEIKSLRDDNCAYRKESEGMADIKLRLKVAEMYIDDDEAIDQLLAAKKEKLQPPSIMGERAGAMHQLLGMQGVGARQAGQAQAMGLRNYSGAGIWI